MTLTPSELELLGDARVLLSDMLQASGARVTRVEEQQMLTQLEIGLEHLKRKWQEARDDAAH